MLRRLADLFRLRGFMRDRRGVSAVEFAIVAPILILTYLGLADLSLGMMASRRASHLAAMIGDLAAQSETLTDANVNDLFAIGTSMMDPFTTGTNLKIRLTSVKMISSKATVQWCDIQNFPKYANGAVISTITTTQLAEGESLIMTEVEYDYTSPIGLMVSSNYSFLPSANFVDTFYHHPRNGAAVTRTTS